jgi:hypothetical protein
MEFYTMAQAKIEVQLSNGAKAGQTLKELGKQANTLNKELKDLRPGTEAFAKKAADLRVVEERMSGIKSQIKGTTEASDTLKDSFDKFIPFAGQFKGIGENLGFVTKGVGGLSNSFGLLRGAIISTGIGALIVLLGSLIAYFTSTQEGIDKLTAVTRPLQAVFQALMKVVQDLGGKVFKQFASALENPMQAIKDLGKAILDNLLNRFKAITLVWPAIKKILSGDMKQGFKDLGNAALQAALGVENVIDKVQAAGKAIVEMSKEAWAAAQRAWEIGQRIDALQKAIEKAEIDQIKRSKQLDLQIKQQKFLLEDQTKSWDERRAAARAALAAQEQLLNLELNLMDMKIQKMRLEHSLGNVTREQQKELAELEAQRFEKEAQITEQRIEFRNKIIEIDKAQAAELLAILTNLEDLRIERMKESQDKEIALIDIGTARKIAALKGSEEQIIEQLSLLTEVREKQIAEIRDKYAQEEAEKEQARIDERKAKQEAALNEELAFWDSYYLDKEVALMESLVNGDITQREYEELALENRQAFLDRELQILKDNGQQETDAYKQIQAEKIRLELDAQDRIRQARQATYDAGMDLGNSFLDAQVARIERENAANDARLERIKEQYGEESSAYKTAALQIEVERKKNGERIKKFEKTKVRINLLSEIANIWLNANSFPFPYSAVIGGILTASAVIRANQNMAQIDAQKYGDGGLIEGPGHDQGGVPARVRSTGEQVELEGNEFVFSRKATKAIGVNRLNAINDHYTRKFATGGPVSPFQNTPAAADTRSSATAAADSQVDAMVEMRGLISDLVAAQDRRIDRIKVINVVTETQDGINTVNQIQADADV